MMILTVFLETTRFGENTARSSKPRLPGPLDAAPAADFAGASEVSKAPGVSSAAGCGFVVTLGSYSFPDKMMSTRPILARHSAVAFEATGLSSRTACTRQR